LTTIILQNIPDSICTHSIEELCRAYGLVNKVVRRGNEATIVMPIRKQAKTAFNSMQGMSLLGQRLAVKMTE